MTYAAQMMPDWSVWSAILAILVGVAVVVLAGGIMFVGSQLWHISGTLVRLTTVVEEMKADMAAVVARSDDHERRITNLEARR